MIVMTAIWLTLLAVGLGLLVTNAAYLVRRPSITSFVGVVFSVVAVVTALYLLLGLLTPATAPAAGTIVAMAV